MPQKNTAERLVQIVQRAYQFSWKGRREGLLELANDLDLEALKQRDIFEFGMRLAIEGIEPEVLNTVLSNMSNLEPDDEARRIKTIQKEAVLGIQKEINSVLLLNTLFSHMNAIEMEEALGSFRNTDIYEVFKNELNSSITSV